MKAYLAKRRTQGQQWILEITMTSANTCTWECYWTRHREKEWESCAYNKGQKKEYGIRNVKELDERTGKIKEYLVIGLSDDLPLYEIPDDMKKELIIKQL